MPSRPLPKNTWWREWLGLSRKPSPKVRKQSAPADERNPLWDVATVAVPDDMDEQADVNRQIAASLADAGSYGDTPAFLKDIGSWEQDARKAVAANALLKTGVSKGNKVRFIRPVPRPRVTSLADENRDAMRSVLLAAQSLVHDWLDGRPEPGMSDARMKTLFRDYRPRCDDRWLIPALRHSMAVGKHTSPPDHKRWTSHGYRLASTMFEKAISDYAPGPGDGRPSADEPDNPRDRPKGWRTRVPRAGEIPNP